jgi:hypothetical protein
MTVRDIVNMTAIAAVDAQAREAAPASPAVVESGEVQELAAPSR